MYLWYMVMKIFSFTKTREQREWFEKKHQNLYVNMCTAQNKKTYLKWLALQF